jgi:hypothetical protein
VGEDVGEDVGEAIQNGQPKGTLSGVWIPNTDSAMRRDQ